MFLTFYLDFEKMIVHGTYYIIILKHAFGFSWILKLLHVWMLMRDYDGDDTIIVLEISDKIHKMSSREWENKNYGYILQDNIELYEIVCITMCCIYRGIKVWWTS